MNPLNRSIQDDNIINMADGIKPKGILINNHRESYENWFVDTIIRTGFFIFSSIIFIPLIVLGIYYSTKNYNCNTHIINTKTLLLCCGIKTLVAYIILSARIYNESSLTTVSDKIINFFRRFSKVHIFYEMFYNSFIVYSIHNMKISNCDMIPFTYFIIYLILNYFGIFIYWICKMA